MKVYLILLFSLFIISVQIEAATTQGTNDFEKAYEIVAEAYEKTKLHRAPVEPVEICIDCETPLELSENVSDIIDMLAISDTVAKNEKLKLQSLIALTQEAHEKSKLDKSVCGLNKIYKPAGSLGGNEDFLTATLTYTKELPIEDIKSFHFDLSKSKLLTYKMKDGDKTTFVVIHIDKETQKTEISFYENSQTDNNLPDMDYTGVANDSIIVYKDSKTFVAAGTEVRVQGELSTDKQGAELTAKNHITGTSLSAELDNQGKLEGEINQEFTETNTKLVSKLEKDGEIKTKLSQEIPSTNTSISAEVTGDGDFYTGVNQSIPYTDTDVEVSLNQDDELKANIVQNLEEKKITLSTKIDDDVDAKLTLQDRKTNKKIVTLEYKDKKPSVTFPLEFDLFLDDYKFKGDHTLSTDSYRFKHVVTAPRGNTLDYSYYKNERSSAEVFKIKQNTKINKGGTLSIEFIDTSGSTNPNQLNQEEVWLTFRQVIN